MTSHGLKNNIAVAHPYHERKSCGRRGLLYFSFRKQAYSNILTILPPKKKKKKSDKSSDIFHILAKNIDCRYSLEPPR